MILGIVGAVRWAVGRISRARDMSKDEVVSSEQFGPTCLATVEDLGAHEYFEILVISEYGNGMFGALEVIAPML